MDLNFLWKKAEQSKKQAILFVLLLAAEVFPR
jgi:hypothetical protein